MNGAGRTGKIAAPASIRSKPLPFAADRVHDECDSVAGRVFG
jgi:hypothetical protein